MKSMIDILNNNSRNENINFRLASLDTIEHIVSDLDYEDLNKNQINIFLGSIF